jgi:hypothetical protein
MAAARSAGAKVIARFVYGWHGTRPDADGQVVLRHIQQLKPVLNDNQDVLAWLTDGFVGYWGEWHDSQNGLLGGAWGTDLTDKSRAILDALFDATPASRMVSLRYPTHKSQYFKPSFTGDWWTDTSPMPSSSTAFTGSKDSRAANHLDSLLSSPYEDYGYAGADAQTEAMRARVREENKYVVQSGEPDQGLNATAQLNTCANATATLSSMRWTAVNQGERTGTDGTAAAVNVWRSGGCYEQIAAQLGYRFNLLRASVQKQVQAGQGLAVSFVLKNVGYATPFNPRALAVVLRNRDTGTRYTLPILQERSNTLDPRKWYSESGEITVSAAPKVPADVPAGSYDVLLSLHDPMPSLSARPEYSIRFANKDVWEAATGLNRLVSGVSITR